MELNAPAIINSCLGIMLLKNLTLTRDPMRIVLPLLVCDVTYAGSPHLRVSSTSPTPSVEAAVRIMSSRSARSLRRTDAGYASNTFLTSIFLKGFTICFAWDLVAWRALNIGLHDRNGHMPVLPEKWLRKFEQPLLTHRARFTS